MQAKKRYAYLACLLCISAAFYFLLIKPHFRSKNVDVDHSAVVDFSQEENLYDSAPSYLDFQRDILDETDILGVRVFQKFATAEIHDDLSKIRSSHCSMSSCFNFSRCLQEFKVHVYPAIPLGSDREAFKGGEQLPPISEAYTKLLSALKESRYLTTDPDKACIFILAYDSMDRDPLSGNFLLNLPSRIRALPKDLWRNGLNHLIFNLYQGTWPDYSFTDLQFDPGLAMLARASSSVRDFRGEFDISFPLFHQELPLRGFEPEESGLKFPGIDRYLLVFKGKRYVHGIGSETRNSLFHLHNGRDVVMLTTCKHGKSWKQLQDDRCGDDNLEYEKWNYEVMMANATFCLVPRGRRLGSFRFLETLRAGCIPVLLSNDWELPFSEVIDWKQAVIWADERLLFQVPEILRSIPQLDIVKMKQQGQKIFRLYFSSVEKIVFTCLEIIRDRIERWKGRNSLVWNSLPSGALHHSMTYSRSPEAFPLQPKTLSAIENPAFTALIYSGVDGSGEKSRLLKLVSVVTRSRFCKKVVVLWANSAVMPKWTRRTVNHVPIQVVNLPRNKTVVSSRLLNQYEILTPAIFSLDDRIQISLDEINFGMEVWRWFPSRLAGYLSRTHFWDSRLRSWKYSSKLSNHFSMVLTDAAVFHRYYLHLFAAWLSPALYRVLEEAPECQDILFNILITETTGQPPIKLGSRSSVASGIPPDRIAYKTRQMCFNTFIGMKGGVPLIRSRVNFDPVLFRDPVSIDKKKYRNMESSDNLSGVLSVGA